MNRYIPKSPCFVAMSCLLLFSGAEALAELVPKASDDASYLITLLSNQENTRFYIDDKLVGVSKDGELQVLINPRKAHSFSAEAPGYSKLSPPGMPPNFNYSGINDKIRFQFLYSDKTGYEPPERARTEIHIKGGTIYGPVGGGHIKHQEIKGGNSPSRQHESEKTATSSSRASIGFNKEELELVKSACLAGGSFEFLTEADGTISVRNLGGKGKLHVTRKNVDTVDLPDADKKQEFTEIRECIKDYLFPSRR